MRGYTTCVRGYTTSAHRTFEIVFKMMKRKAEDVSTRGNVPKQRKAVGGGCSFMQSWTAEFKTIKHSNQGTTKAFCTICTAHFSVGHGGRSDVKRHVDNKQRCNKYLIFLLK